MSEQEFEPAPTDQMKRQVDRVEDLTEHAKKMLEEFFKPREPGLADQLNQSQSEQSLIDLKVIPDLQISKGTKEGAGAPDIPNPGKLTEDNEQSKAPRDKNEYPFGEEQQGREGGGGDGKQRSEEGGGEGNQGNGEQEQEEQEQEEQEQEEQEQEEQEEGQEGEGEGEGEEEEEKQGSEGEGGGGGGGGAPHDKTSVETESVNVDGETEIQRFSIVTDPEGKVKSRTKMG